VEEKNGKGPIFKASEEYAKSGGRVSGLSYIKAPITAPISEGGDFD
jgi:hypothetical protein